MVTSKHIHGQKLPFKNYINAIHKFSFEIPIGWTIKYSYEQECLVCTPISLKEKKSFADCFEGIDTGQTTSLNLKLSY
jgi:hypothetical protein